MAAAIGLGNARYTLKEYAAAECAYREATRVTPRSGAAWNNLALALHKLGRKEEAKAAARAAIVIGGRDIEAFRATLREVSGEDA